MSCTVKEATKLYFLTQISFLIAATSMIHTPVIRQCILIYPSNKKFIPKNEDIFYLHISWERQLHLTMGLQTDIFLFKQ